MLTFWLHPPVLRRLGHSLLIAALLAAVGGHWMILQSFAWATMLVENLQTASLSQAVEQTFDGAHPCKLCKQIAANKQSEKKSDQLLLKLKKFDLLSDAQRHVFAAPTAFHLLPAWAAYQPYHTHAPPLPPPRSLPV